MSIKVDVEPILTDASAHRLRQQIRQMIREEIINMLIPQWVRHLGRTA